MNKIGDWRARQLIRPVTQDRLHGRRCILENMVLVEDGYELSAALNDRPEKIIAVRVSQGGWIGTVLIRYQI